MLLLSLLSVSKCNPFSLANFFIVSEYLLLKSSQVVEIVSAKIEQNLPFANFRFTNITLVFIETGLRLPNVDICNDSE